MTDKRNPAFPHQKEDGSPYWGMELRDYFAAKALPAIVTSISTTHPAKLDEEAQKIGFVGSYQQFAARIAYDYADAMMDERERRSFR